MTAGGLLIVGGILGFLPVLGLWMAPLGALVLSVDLPVARRLRRRLEVWWGRKRWRKPAEPVDLKVESARKD